MTITRKLDNGTELKIILNELELQQAHEEYVYDCDIEDIHYYLEETVSNEKLLKTMLSDGAFISDFVCYIGKQRNNGYGGMDCVIFAAEKIFSLDTYIAKGYKYNPDKF